MSDLGHREALSSDGSVASWREIAFAQLRRSIPVTGLVTHPHFAAPFDGLKRSAIHMIVISCQGFRADSAGVADSVRVSFVFDDYVQDAEGEPLLSAGPVRAPMSCI